MRAQSKARVIGGGQNGAPILKLDVLLAKLDVLLAQLDAEKRKETL